MKIGDGYIFFSIILTNHLVSKQGGKIQNIFSYIYSVTSKMIINR